jgi:hypothetical protein
VSDGVQLDTGQVEARLHMERIPRVEPPDFELPAEIKAQLGEAKYGQSVSTRTPLIMLAYPSTHRGQGSRGGACLRACDNGVAWCGVAGVVRAP